MTTRAQMEHGNAYPVGEYEFEIKSYEHQSGISAKNGQSWEKALLKTEIVSPQNLAGKRFTTGLFYDKQFLRLITIGVGGKIDDIFDGPGPDAKVDQAKVDSLLSGSFFRAKLGIDPNGYNRIAEVLPPIKNETTAKSKVTEQV